MAVTPGDVRRVAVLARLELEASQVEELAGQLTRILGHMAELEEADADGTAPTPRESEGAPLRSDRPAPDPLAFPAGHMAPEWAHGFFTLPRLPALGGEGGAEETGETL